MLEGQRIASFQQKHFLSQVRKTWHSEFNCCSHCSSVMPRIHTVVVSVVKQIKPRAKCKWEQHEEHKKADEIVPTFKRLSCGVAIWKLSSERQLAHFKERCHSASPCSDKTHHPCRSHPAKMHGCNTAASTLKSCIWQWALTTMTFRGTWDPFFPRNFRHRPAF